MQCSVDAQTLMPTSALPSSKMLAGSRDAALTTMLSSNGSLLDRFDHTKRPFHAKILRLWILTVEHRERIMFSQSIRLIEDSRRLPRNVGPVGQPEPIESYLRVGHLIGPRVDIYPMLYCVTAHQIENIGC